MNKPHTHSHGRWLKAAVIGSTWASFEIIIGSFLHNLHIPFAGMLLAASSVVLLAAFAQLWPQRGIIIRAGLICALMKSVSPSALIFGPMIGITAEALLFEGVTLLFGRKLPALLLAGGLAVLWTLVQKIVNLLLLYGFNLVHIAEAFLQYLQKITGLQGWGMADLLGLISAGYLSVGMLAAWVGWQAGQRYKAQTIALEPLPLNHDASFLSDDSPRKHPFWHILLILLLVAGSLFLLNSGRATAGVGVGMVFLLYALTNYRRNLRRLLKPSVWMQFAGITVLAAMLWEWLASGSLFSVQGLYVGLEMNFRAVVVLVAFPAISVELRSPVVRSLLHRHGFSSLYKASSMAFSALPALIAALPQPRRFLKSRQQLMQHILGRSESLYAQFERMGLPKVVFITGGVHAGKSGFVQQLLRLMQQHNISYAGIRAEAVVSGQTLTGYRLHILPEDEVVDLATTEKQAGWHNFSRFWFNPQALRLGNERLKQLANKPGQWVVIDETGPMELKGGGWSDGLHQLLQAEAVSIVWVVRSELLSETIRHFGLENTRVIDISSGSPAATVQLLLEYT